MNKKWFNLLLNGTARSAKVLIACSISIFAVGQISAAPTEASASAMQQQARVNVTGKVLDTSGEPIIGGSVSVKGTANGAMTDIDGNFILNNVPTGGTLVFSYLGYENQEVNVDGKTSFNVVLKEDAQMLDEVVVEVGYGQTKRANLLGAVANVTSDAIKDIPATSLTETLYGKMPGISISINNGTPGNNPSMTIRKGSSYASSQPPLYVIDGIVKGVGESEEFNRLDPNDIESISILKDASAAVYGARGTGGVILVRTKMGKEGKPKISYSGSVGISDRTSFPEMMSGTQHATFLNDAYDTAFGRNVDGTTASVPRSQFRSQLTSAQQAQYYTDSDLAEIGNRNYDWLDEYWSASVTTKHNLSLSGGAKDVNYSTSLSYTNQNGNISDLTIEQYSFRVGVEAKITSGLKGRFNMDTSSKNKRLPYNQADSSDGTMKNTFQSLMRTPRWMPYEVDGKPVTFGSMPDAGTSKPSHIDGFSRSYNRSKDIRSNFSINLSYDFSDIKALKGLTVGATYARSTQTNNGTQYRVPYELYYLQGSESGKIPTYEFTTVDGSETMKVENGDRISFSSSYSQNVQMNLNVNYARRFDKHNLHAMFNYEETTSKGNNFSLYRDGILIYDWERLEAFGKDVEGGNGYSNGAGRAYIGRLNYDYADKYLLESNFRYESSSSFPAKSRWGFFPSVSLGWRLSEEDWYNVKFMDSFKLRSSLGLVGDDSAKSLQWILYYGAVSNAGYLGGDKLSGIRPNNSGVINSDLKWETTCFFNIGFDARLFNTFDLSVDAWQKNTWDVLDASTSDYPSTSGYGQELPKRNYGAMKSWGYEASLSYNGQINKDMSYSIGGNISWSDNKIKKIIQSAGVEGTYQDKLGRRSDTGIEGYKCLGMIRTQEDLDAVYERYPEYSLWGDNVKPQLGMLYYEDLNGDGKITDADKCRLEDISSNPISVGFNLGFRWKDLSFKAQFTGGFGGNAIMNKNDYILPTNTANGLKMWNDHWTPENPNASMPRASITAQDAATSNLSVDSYQPSNFWIKDGTEIRLRSATVSYNVPKGISSRIGLSDLRFFATGTNLFVLVSPFDYKDPSLSYFDSYPIMRTFNFGINITL